MEENIDSELGSLLDQLKNNNVAAKSAQKETDPLKKEDMEKFVVEKAGILVNESLAMVKDIKDFVMAAPEGESVAALAGLISATAGALETINKIIVADKKSNTSVKLKEMDVQMKRQLVEDNTKAKILLTREELIKQLTLQAEDKKANSIEAEVISSSSVPVSGVTDEQV